MPVIAEFLQSRLHSIVLQWSGVSQGSVLCLHMFKTYITAAQSGGCCALTSESSEKSTE